MPSKSRRHLPCASIRPLPAWKLRAKRWTTRARALPPASERDARPRTRLAPLRRAGARRQRAELRLRQLRSRVATETVALRVLELENARRIRSAQEIGAAQRAVRVQLLKAGARISEEELRLQLARIDKEEAALRTELAAAKTEVSTAEREWVAAQRRAAEVGADAVSVRRLALQTRQLAVTTLAQGIARLGEARELWQRRLAIANGTEERSQLSAWVEETQRALTELARQQRLQQSQVAELNAQRRKQEARPAAAEASAARWQRIEIDELAAQTRVHERALASLEEAQRIHERTLAELQDALETVSISERLGDAWSAIGSAWRYELFAVDDSPITVARITIGALLLVIGLLFSGFLSRLFGRRLLPRLGIEAGAAAAIESLLYYAFVVGLVLLALRTVNVPLTAFTLLGGAAAIGLGFGSQNVINNFISGLILFAERPIRVGDMIEIDGTYGSVESIGARSTRVRSFTGIHIIVPNSAFLEKNVVNWTLSDDRVRTHVSVGVTYGSPVADVFLLIRQAVDEQPGVLRVPEPVVLFSDFGNDALLFEVHFWIRMRTLMDRRRIESDVRRTLDQLFRDAGIVIAFPQRDVHFDTSRPLSVRMVPESPPE